MIADIKLGRKTGFMQAALLGVTCMLAAGCAGQTWLNPLTGEPDQSVSVAPQISRTGQEDPAWPNLATVPPRPADTTPPGERARQMEELEANRDQAKAVLQETAPYQAHLIRNDGP